MPTASTLTFTPSHFFKFAICPHWIWHDLFSDPTRKKQMPELALKLIEEGVIHENRIIADMKMEEVNKDLSENEAVADLETHAGRRTSYLSR